MYFTLEERLLNKSSQKYEYILNEVTYDTEESVHVADASTCLANEHDWKKSYVFRRYSCKNCEAMRARIQFHKPNCWRLFPPYFDDLCLLLP